MSSPSSVALSVLLALVSCAATQEPTPVLDREPHAGTIGILVGARALDPDTWSPIEDQIAVGVEGDWEVSSLPFGFELGLAGSSEETTGDVPGFGTVTAKATFAEFYGGVRKNFLPHGRWHPYLGAGVTWMVVDVSATNGVLAGDEADDSLGGYAHTGVRFDASRRLVLGLDVRGVFATEPQIAGTVLDADYVQVALFVGFGF